VTFLSYAARAGSRFDLVVSSGGLFPLDGTIAVILTEDLAFDFIGAPPTSGAFDVVIPAETISVTVVASGVQLSLSGGEVIPYTWDEFENLLDDDALRVPVRELLQRRRYSGRTGIRNAH
jgi:hypothetical protein